MRISEVTLTSTNLLRLYNAFDFKRIDFQGDETQTFLCESVLKDSSIEIDIEFEISMNRDYDTDKMTHLDFVDTTITAFVDRGEVGCIYSSELNNECKKDIESLINRNYFDER